MTDDCFVYKPSCGVARSSRSIAKEINFSLLVYLRCFLYVLRLIFDNNPIKLIKIGNTVIFSEAIY